jgi:hypothetical protein
MEIKLDILQQMAVMLQDMVAVVAVGAAITEPCMAAQDIKALS